MLNTLVVGSGTGVTSCLSVRLHDAVRHREYYGEWPDKIDSSNQFSIYRDKKDQDVSIFIFGPYDKPDREIECLNYNHGWQYEWYDEIHLDKIYPLAKNICRLSESIVNKSFDFLNRIEDRVAVLYRGNDKNMEIGAAPYEDIFEIAMQTGAKSFIVQTDEKEFYDAFCKIFPDTICFNEIPTMNRDYKKYVMPESGKRVSFATNFLSALMAISKAKNLILTTGNTGIWTMLFRGTTEGVYQYHGGHRKWRKLSQK